MHAVLTYQALEKMAEILQTFGTVYVSAEDCPQIRKCQDYRSYAYKQALIFQYIGPRVVLSQ